MTTPNVIETTTYASADGDDFLPVAELPSASQPDPGAASVLVLRRFALAE